MMLDNFLIAICQGYNGSQGWQEKGGNSIATEQWLCCMCRRAVSLWFLFNPYPAKQIQIQYEISIAKMSIFTRLRNEKWSRFTSLFRFTNSLIVITTTKHGPDIQTWFQWVFSISFISYSFFSILEPLLTLHLPCKATVWFSISCGFNSQI